MSNINIERQGDGLIVSGLITAGFALGKLVIDADEARELALRLMAATDVPQAWADLIEAMTIMARHPADGVCPTHCEHDRLNVMADPASFTPEELQRLEALSFNPGDGPMRDTLGSNRFGSA